MECIAVSYCLSKDDCIDQDKYRFHFKGYFAGKKVREIEVIGKDDKFLIGSEYILHLRVEGINKGILSGKCLRQKILDEISTDFL